MSEKEKIENSANDKTPSRRKYKKVSKSLKFLVIAFAIGIGYIAGVYHFQIEAAIGPVFGYNAHQGEIDLSSLQETYSKLAANFDGDIDVQKLIDGANAGLVDAAGDQYTTYMTSAEAEEYNNSLSGNIGGGIGAEITKKNNQITINSVIDGNPAKAAGLQAGDAILKINDESTDGMTVDQAVSKIRGDVGTTIKLTIQRNNETKEYSITRATINNPSVQSRINDGIGVMTISRFDSDTGELAREAAQEFISKNVKGIILDLRNNGGGYVTAAQQVAGLWLDSKIVVTEKAGNVVKDTIKTSDDAILSGISTIVLVNGSTASASEIVSGALQDYNVAKIVGEQTYGKGCVQKLISLSSGSVLKVTIAKWYTPNDKNISSQGITPDYAVELTDQDFNNSLDPQMDKAVELLQS